MLEFFKNIFKKLRNTINQEKYIESYKDLINIFRRVTPLEIEDVDNIHTILRNLVDNPTVLDRKMRILKSAMRNKAVIKTRYTQFIKDEFKKLAKRELNYENDVSYCIGGKIVYGDVDSDEENKYFTRENVESLNTIPLKPKKCNFDCKTDECRACVEKRLRDEITRKLEIENQILINEKIKKRKTETDTITDLNEKFGIPRLFGRYLCDDKFKIEDLDEEERSEFLRWKEEQKKGIDKVKQSIDLYKSIYDPVNQTSAGTGFNMGSTFNPVESNPFNNNTFSNNTFNNNTVSPFNNNTANPFNSTVNPFNKNTANQFNNYPANSFNNTASNIFGNNDDYKSKEFTEETKNPFSAVKNSSVETKIAANQIVEEEPSVIEIISSDDNGNKDNQIAQNKVVDEKIAQPTDDSLFKKPLANPFSTSLGNSNDTVKINENPFSLINSKFDTASTSDLKPINPIANPFSKPTDTVTNPFSKPVNPIANPFSKPFSGNDASTGSTFFGNSNLKPSGSGVINPFGNSDSKPSNVMINPFGSIDSKPNNTIPNPFGNNDSNPSNPVPNPFGNNDLKPSNTIPNPFGNIDLKPSNPMLNTSNNDSRTGSIFGTFPTSSNNTAGNSIPNTFSSNTIFGNPGVNPFNTGNLSAQQSNFSNANIFQLGRTEQPQENSLFSTSGNNDEDNIVRKRRAFRKK